MPIIKKDKAVILMTRDHGESDKTVTLITSKYGRINAIAKGAKRSKKRFVNTLEPFTSLSVVMAQSRVSSMHRIESASIINSFPEIHKSYRGYLMASLCCELTSLWTVEADMSRAIFQLLTWYLENLIYFEYKLNPTFFFQEHLLSLAGIGLNYNSCIKCGTDFRHCPEWLFSPESGGFLCRNCHNKGNFIQRDIIYLMRHIFNSPKEKLQRLKMTERQNKIIWKILREMHSYHLGKVPASYKLITI